jgi:hypothetical protein
VRLTSGCHRGRFKRDCCPRVDVASVTAGGLTHNGSFVVPKHSFIALIPPDGPNGSDSDNGVRQCLGAIREPLLRASQAELRVPDNVVSLGRAFPGDRCLKATTAVTKNVARVTMAHTLKLLYPCCTVWPNWLHEPNKVFSLTYLRNSRRLGRLIHEDIYRAFPVVCHSLRLWLGSRAQSLPDPQWAVWSVRRFARTSSPTGIGPRSDAICDRVFTPGTERAVRSCKLASMS